MKFLYIKNLISRVIDNLTSTDTDAALSAKQGKLLNEKIATIPSTSPAPPPINPATLIVDTSLSTDDVDKAPSVHLTKDSLSSKVSLDSNTNLIPKENLPAEMFTIEDLKIIGGANIKVTTTDDETYIISKADTKEDILGYINDINLGSATSKQKWIDICYCMKFDSGAGMYLAIAEDTDKAMKSTDGKTWEEITLPISMKYHCIAYDNVLKMICIVADNSKEILVSNDDAIFTKVTLPVTDNIRIADITSICGRFVILSKIGELFVSVNDDCTNWQKIAPTVAIGPNKVYNAICYNDRDKRLAIVGNDNSQFLISSKISINDINTINTFTSHRIDDYEFVDVAYSYELDMYCAVGGENAPDILDKVYTSIDGGITWKSNKIRASDWKKCIWVPNWKTFVFMSSQEKICAISLDGNNFDIVNLPEIDTNVSNYSSLCYSSKNDRLVLTIYNSDKFAAMNIDGKKLKLRWTKHYVDISDDAVQLNLQSICWSPELRMFCAVTYNTNTNKAITSSDGIIWTERTLPSSNNWRNICWSPELRMFCAIAYNTNKAITSSDGTTWTERTLPNSHNWKSICWSPELRMFCAVGSSNKAITSPDGTTWTERTLPGNQNFYQSICWSPELHMFCIVGYDNKAVTSSDGITWIERPLPDTNYLESICWSPELRMFCAVGSSSSKVVTSSDGITWTERTSPSNNNWKSMCWSPELRMFCAVAYNINKVTTSLNGITWIKKPLPGNQNFYQSICWSPELRMFCAVGSSNKAITSPDGITWKEHAIFVPQWVDICWSPKLRLFCIIGNKTNKIATSPDGITWTERTLPSSQIAWRSICWAPKLEIFYAVALNNNKAATSSDGITWTERTLSVNNSWRAICWSEDLSMFCSIYDTNKVGISSNGTTWEQKASLSNVDWSSICWSSELRMFCAIAYDTNKLATSPDGITWTERTLPSRANWSSICWAPKLRMFYAVAYNSNKLATSSDGINWIETSLPSIDKFGSICWAQELEKFLILTVRGDVDKSVHSDAYLIGNIDG